MVFLEGFMQTLMPAFLEHVLTALSAAATDACWHPYPKQLGVRCVETLVYYSGGELMLHTDSERYLYTIRVYVCA